MQSPQLSSGQKLTIVAGKTAGKGVYATEEASATIKLLKVASQKGDYDSTLILRGLESLTSGTQKDNVFISPAQFKRNPSNKDLTLIFRGVTVKARELDTSIVVYDFDVSDQAAEMYSELMEKASVPGLYTVDLNNGIEVIPNPSGDIKNTDGNQRKVAITDGGYASVADAANAAAGVLIKGPDSDFQRKKGFDLHFTPSKKSFGGLLQVKEMLSPLDSKRRDGSALSLAQTMSKSKNIDDILWISELGGSAILTRSLDYCAKQGLDLSKHYVFMHKPTTSPVSALEGAKKVKLKIGDNFYSTGIFDVMGHASRISVGRKRRKTEKNYTGKKEIGNLARLGASVATLAGAAATVTGYTPALLTAVGAVILAKQAFEKIAPKQHNRLLEPFND